MAFLKVRGHEHAGRRRANQPCALRNVRSEIVAANLAAIGVGTETSGSILSPGTANMLIGIKPTVGLISRDGIIPIVADQDTAGPLARTVRDAAILLGVMAGFDPNDPATEACLTPGNCLSDYTRFLDRHALNGARIAVPSNFPANRAAIINNAIDVLRAQGATVNLIPANPYHAAWMEQWQPGKLRHFSEAAASKKR